MCLGVRVLGFRVQGLGLQGLDWWVQEMEDEMDKKEIKRGPQVDGVV